MAEPVTVRHKRLAYRSRYRGFLESDLILGRFAKQHLDDFDTRQLDAFESLLDESDHDIYAWVTDRAPVPAKHDTDVFRMIKDFRVADAPN
ncbi:MAG: succinate dehydrogenase assembly factor 2 [Geminicoccaceae bacterium]